MGRRIYILAGEASGDLHAGALVRALKELQPDLQIRGWGGDHMAAAGCTVVKHYRDLAFMGFVEVVRNLSTIRRNFAFARKDILDFRPDTVVFVDYPGFNLRLLPWVKRQGFRTVWYIAPQVWAWHASRVKILRRWADELLIILPFEAEFFASHGVTARFVGHPLASRIGSFRADPQFRTKWGLDPEGPIAALLPGSRGQELQGILPVMLETARRRADLQWVIAAAPSLPDSLYLEMIPEGQAIHLVRDATYDLLAHSHVALVTSGTATLETALFRVPEVVLYKGNPISFWIARRLVNIAYISLVNLLLDRPHVRELIQHEMTAEKVLEALQELEDPVQRQRIMEGYEELWKSLGGRDASSEAAQVILG